MFGKINKQIVQHHFNKAKSFIGNAYHHTKNFLNDVDRGVKTFKHVYSVVSPYIDKYAGNNKLHAPIMNAVSKYDEIKSKVIEGHDNIKHDLNNVKHKLLY